MSKGKGKIKVGLVGVGRAGWGMHCRELAKLPRLFKIVAACDIDRKRCRQVGDALGCRTYTKVRDLVADPEVELVDITTRSVDHAEQAILAVKAGKPVFMEKPIAASYAEAKRMGRAAKRMGVDIYCRHNRRFEPAFQHVRGIIDSGILGDVHSIKLCRGGYQRRTDWQTILKFGGGQLLNWGPHVIDHALQLLDAPVVDMWSDLQRIAAAGDAEDCVRILLKGENGRLADVQIGGGMAMREPECMVHGSRGSLVVRGSEIQMRYISPRQKLTRLTAKRSTPPNQAGFGNTEKLRWIDKTLPVKPGKRGDMGTTIWRHLYDAMRKGKPFPIKWEEALEVMRIIDLARKGTEFELL